MRQYWAAQLGPLHLASGSALASSTTLTDVSPTPPILIPSNLLDVGMEIELCATLNFSTTGTPTLLVGFYHNGVANTVIGATSAVTTGSGAAAWPIEMYWRGRVRSIGTSGTIVGKGHVKFGTALTSYSVRPIPETSAGRTVTIDTTTAKSVTVGAQWGTSSASNTITCDDIAVRIWT
jgi:hypothetical protein